jgi:hypothetical protein
MTMKRCGTHVPFCLVFTLLAGVPSGQSAEAVQVQWVRQFHFVAGQYEEVRALAVAASGVYAVGICVAPAVPDAFVTKRDAAGSEVWRHIFGTTRGDSASAVAVDDSGLYVGGYSGPLPNQPFVGGDSDAFIRKYDLDGNEVWTRAFGSKTPGVENYGRDGVVAIALTSDAVYAVGSSEGPLPGQVWLGGSDAFVCKYDKNGGLLWLREFGSAPYGDAAHGVAVDATGVYVIGDGYATVDGVWQAFVRKYDHDGNLLWHRTFGDPNALENGRGVAVDETGVYIHGATRGTLPGQVPVGGDDNFIRKFTTTGVELWTRQYGTSANDGCGAMVAVPGGVLVVGTTRGTFPGQTAQGGEDGFARKYDPDGNVVWTLQLGTPQNDPTPAVAVGASGLYIGGSTLGTFPGQTNGGSADAYVAKLQRSPTAYAGLDLLLGSSEQPGKIIAGMAGDPDFDLLTYRWMEGSTPLTAWENVTAAGACPLDLSALPLGQHVLTLKVSDGYYEVQDSMTLEIVDNEPPLLTPVADKTVLWPPNHQMVPVNVVANATDNSAGPLTLAVSVSSTEPQNGLGDGDTAPDWETVSINPSTGVIRLSLRAERSGNGSGRIYTVTITATDPAGNQGQARVLILVPRVKS